MFFEFEADFVEALRCIPMQVRLKLDTCGIKLKLQDWNHFNQAERQMLVEKPCLTPAEIIDDPEHLNQVLIKHIGKPGTDLPLMKIPRGWMLQLYRSRFLQKRKSSASQLLWHSGRVCSRYSDLL